MEGANKHSFKDDLKFIFYIQSMYGLHSCRSIHVHVYNNRSNIACMCNIFLFIQSFNNQLNSTLISNGVHILYIHTYILISISISINFKLIFKQKAKNITESPHKSTVHPININTCTCAAHAFDAYLSYRKKESCCCKSFKTIEGNCFDEIKEKS